MDRREFLTASAALALLAGREQAAAQGRQYRVAVLGHTGRGNYGHDLDAVWLDVPGARIVGVADPDEKGRAAARERLKANSAYADYRELLSREKPELVSIAPRWPDQHHAMLLACAEARVKGVLIEKPLARTLEEADAMVAAAERVGMKAVVAHQSRYSPRVTVIRQLLQEGRIGDLIEVRARGKEDSRGGGEDLMVLGDHLLDLTRLLAGNPEWCFARVTQGGKPVTRAEVRAASEDLGPIAGDAIVATYGLPGGAVGYFGSQRARAGAGQRFGLSLYGTKGVISLGTGTLPPAWLLEDASWTLFQGKGSWQPITSAGVGGEEPLKDGSLRAGNRLAAADLIRCVEERKEPLSSLRDGRASLEMILAVYESHRRGGPVPLPLETRKHPLELLT